MAPLECANRAHLSCAQIRVDALYDVAERLQQEFVRIKPGKEHEREALLLTLASRTYTSRTIIFVSSKASRRLLVAARPHPDWPNCDSAYGYCASHKSLCVTSARHLALRRAPTGYDLFLGSLNCARPSYTAISRNYSVCRRSRHSA